jgi:hypothetical protein
MPPEYRIALYPNFFFAAKMFFEDSSRTSLGGRSAT